MMDLQVKNIDGLLCIVNGEMVYNCGDEVDMKILCKLVNAEISYITKRHNLALTTCINIEDKLKELDTVLSKLDSGAKTV